jgi:REP element-mobilizing transposase RayT
VARRVRVEEIGFYHVINRGVERRDIFLCDDDRDRFIKIIDESAMLYKFSVHCFCLMDNHYHFLIETTERNLSLLMRQINSKYSIYFNKQYKRVGPLWPEINISKAEIRVFF